MLFGLAELEGVSCLFKFSRHSVIPDKSSLFDTKSAIFFASVLLFFGHNT